MFVEGLVFITTSEETAASFLTGSAIATFGAEVTPLEGAAFSTTALTPFIAIIAALSTFIAVEAVFASLEISAVFVATAAVSILFTAVLVKAVVHRAVGAVIITGVVATGLEAFLLCHLTAFGIGLDAASCCAMVVEASVEEDVFAQLALQGTII